MAKRRRCQDSDVTATETAEFNTVFVDTSLDTHLAMLVSSFDTVSDFKKKMALEHKHCFPTIGEIQVHSVKVERRSNFYHLPDVMLLWSAFHGEVKGNWFLVADVSGARTCHSVKNSSELNTRNGVRMGVPNNDDNCRSLSPDENRIQALPMPLPDAAATEKTIVSSEKKSSKTDSRPWKKRKMRKTECHNHSSEDACTFFQASGKDTSKPDIVSCVNLMADSVRESPKGNGISFPDGTAQVSVVRNDRFEETSPHITAERSNLRSEMTCRNALDYDETNQDNMDELAHDAPIKHSDGVSVNVPGHFAISMGAGGEVGEVNTDGGKWKKKKVQDTTDMEQQTGKGETVKLCSVTHQSDLQEKEKGSSVQENHGTVMPSSSRASDHLDPLKQSWDADAGMEPKISKKKKKKKTTWPKKPGDSNLEISGIEQAGNCISSSPCLLLPLTDHIPEETGIKHHEKKDVQMFLDCKDGSSVKKTAEKSTQSLYSNCHADIPTVEAKNPIIEFNKVDKGGENTGNKNKKSSKKRKKKNLPGEDQQVDIDSLATNKDTPIGVVNSEHEGTQVEDSSQVLYGKTEKSNKIHGNAENIDDLKTTSEKGGEGINFKQYFVPGQDWDKEDSCHKVKEAKMETTGRVEDNDLSFVNNATELQNSIKSLENEKAENKSHRRDNTRSNGGSAQNSDRDEEGVKDSSPRFETTLQKPDQSIARLNKTKQTLDKSTSVISEVRKQGNKRLRSELNVTNMIPMKTPQKSLFTKSGPIFQETSDESLAASSFLNKKYQTSNKSTSEILPRKQGNKRVQPGLNATNMIPVKTPQKKSLFTKSGAIFQDNGGESSGDENEAMHPGGNTLCPSDSSSMSGGDSVAGSDLSQDSTRNDSNDAEGRSSGRRNMSKLELSSASKELTMDMILKSSKRFKKAKLLASQNEDESQPIEFVPDSQPSLLEPALSVQLLLS